MFVQRGSIGLARGGTSGDIVSYSFNSVKCLCIIQGRAGSRLNGEEWRS